MVFEILMPRGKAPTSAGAARATPPGRKGLAPRAAWAFLGRLAGWYFGLLLLWYPLGDAYRAALIRGGNLLAPVLLPAHEVVFRPYSKWKELGMTERLDLAVLVRLPGGTAAGGEVRHVLAKAVATFHQPFMALVFMLALLMAGRWTWPQRLGRGVGAVALLHLGMLLCVAIDVRHAAAGFGAPAGGELDWGRTVIALLHFTVTDWPAGVLVGPLLLWALLGGPRTLGSSE